MSDFSNLVSLIVVQSEVYTKQKGISFVTDEDKLRAFFGICLVMGYHVLFPLTTIGTYLSQPTALALTVTRVRNFYLFCYSNTFFNKAYHICVKINHIHLTVPKGLSVIRVDVLFTEFIVEHNLHRPCRLIDSKIAMKYSCARTKTACVLDALASSDAQHVIDATRSGPFSIATDGSEMQHHPVTCSEASH